MSATILRMSVCLPILFSLAAMAQTPPTTGTQQPPAAPAPAPAPAASGAEGPDHAFSIQLNYFLSQTKPQLRGGKQAIDFSNLDFGGNPRPAPGGMISIPVTANDVLRLTFFELRGHGNAIAPADATYFDTSVLKGDALNTQYRLRAGKVSFEDLLYPYPGGAHKLHYKTLWEVQYAQISSRIDDPGQAITDSTSGFTTFPSGKGSHQVILPAFGGAIQYAASPRAFLEVHASGFGIPHHSNILDTEASVSYRIGHVRLIVGGKYYHVETSPQKTEFLRMGVAGGFVGLRWIFQ